MVATPGGVTYEESMSRHDPDVNDLCLVPPGGGDPPGLPVLEHDWGTGRRRVLTDVLKGRVHRSWHRRDSEENRPLFNRRTKGNHVTRGAHDRQLCIAT